MDDETRRKILEQVRDDRFSKANTPVRESDAPGLMQDVSSRYRELQKDGSLPPPDPNQPDMYEKSMMNAGGHPLAPEEHKDDQSSNEQNGGFFSNLKNAVASRYNEHMKASDEERARTKSLQDKMFPSLHKNEPGFKEMTPDEEKELYTSYLSGASGMVPAMGVTKDVTKALLPEGLSLADRIASISRGGWKPKGQYVPDNTYNALRKQLGQGAEEAAAVAKENAKNHWKTIVE